MSLESWNGRCIAVLPPHIGSGAHGDEGSYETLTSNCWNERISYLIQLNLWPNSNRSCFQQKRFLNCSKRPRKFRGNFSITCDFLSILFVPATQIMFCSVTSVSTKFFRSKNSFLPRTKHVSCPIMNWNLNYLLFLPMLNDFFHKHWGKQSLLETRTNCRVKKGIIDKRRKWKYEIV